MSFKRVTKEIRKARGQIKGDYYHSNKFCYDNSNTSEFVSPRSTLAEANKDVSESFSSEASTSALEIPNSISLSVPVSAHLDMTHDISGVNVDEWFKQRTECVTSIDIDAVMRNDAYLAENMGSSFLSNKEVDMTCIVTNICDIGLNLDLCTSVDRSKDTTNVPEKDCDTTSLNSYTVVEDPLLNDINGNDIVDKDVLCDSSGIVAASKEAKEKNKEIRTAVIEQGKQSLWTGSEIAATANIQSALDDTKDKTNWDGLISVRRNGDLESEKEIDFPEFNLMTFQIDAGDSICSLSQVTEIQADISKEDSLPSPVKYADRGSSAPKRMTNKDEHDLHVVSKNIPSKAIPLSTEENYKISNINAQKTPMLTIKNRATVSTLNPRSILKSSSKTVTKRPNILRALPNSSDTMKDKPPKPKKTPPPMAIIAISTDKSKNTTQIVINTPHGEQVYKGKTTDLMKATSGLWQKLDSTCKQKLEQPLTISTMENATLQSTSSSNTEDAPVDMSVSLCTDAFVEGGEELDEMSDSEEKQSVLEALTELGIAVEDRDHVFCIATGSGQKLWVCPVKDCGKMYPRRSMLKVHILTHFNIRPFKCNFAGCHWSFYTYFKLKRHKETHMKRKDFMCPEDGCERKFTTVYNLNTHLKLHTRPAVLVCPVESCGSRFQTKHSLEVHMKSHGRHHAPYRCHYEGCGKHYYSLNSLNSHSRIHQHKEEELRCQWEGCNKLFDKPCRLRAHLRSHTGDKPYPCTYENCGWAFPSASKLKRHQRKHTNERNFCCSVEGCGKSFMRSEHLKEHTLTHVGQRNFKCPIENCGVRFSAKSSLYVHLKKHNKTEGSIKNKLLYHCPIEKCIRIYTCKSSLRQHMLKFHTPVLANDPSQLDYITLLTADYDLTALEGLQFSGDVPQSNNGAINSMNAINLVTPQSTDDVGTSTNDSNTDFQLPGMVTTQAVSEGSHAGNDIVTHVVVTQPDMQNISTASLSESTEKGSIFEPVVMLSVENGSGSARTSFTYQDIVRERDKKRIPLGPASSPSEAIADLSSTSSRVPKDVVLGTGLLGTPDIPQSFLLQDDLAGNNLYSEDHMMAVGSGVGEYQVLLLDPSSRHEFAESTINLRDLE